MGSYVMSKKVCQLVHLSVSHIKLRLKGCGMLSQPGRCSRLRTLWTTHFCKAAEAVWPSEICHGFWSCKLWQSDLSLSLLVSSLVHLHTHTHTPSYLILRYLLGQCGCTRMPLARWSSCTQTHPLHFHPCQNPCCALQYTYIPEISFVSVFLCFVMLSC